MKHRHARRRAALVLAALIAGGLAACSERRPVAELVAEARALNAAGSRKAAIIQLKNALLADPDRLEARTLLAAVYADSREHRGAEIEYRRALELAPDSVPLVAGLALALIDQNEFQQALDELDAHGLRRGSLAPPLLVLQGDARLGLGADDARMSYEAALAAAPGLPRALVGLSRLAAAERRNDEALRLVDEALRSAPADVEALLLRGDVLHATARLDAAEEAYRGAQAARSDDTRARLRLAALYIRTDRLDAARAEIAAVKSAEPENLSADYHQAALHMKERDYVRARDLIQLVRARSPNHLASLQIAGTAAFHTDAVEQAERDLTSYLVREPDDAYARKLLAANSLRMGKPDKALATITPLLRSGDDAHAYAIAGEAALGSRQFALAEEYLGKAASLAPRNAGMRALLGLSRIARGDGSAGIADLESAVALGDPSQRPEQMLVRAHLDRGEHQRALAVLARLETQRPRDPDVQHLKALALLAGGDAAASRAALEAALALRPDHHPSIDTLAALDARAGDLDAARARYRALLARDAKSVPALLGLARVAAAAGDGAAQLGWLERAVAAAPADMQPRRLLVQHHLAQGGHRQAIAAARAAHDANPGNAEALAMLARTQFATGHKDESVTTWHAVVKAQPASVDAAYSLARAYLETSQYTAARDALERVLDLRRDHVGAQVALAMLEMRAGRHTGALRIAQRMRERDPRSPAGPALEGDVRTAQGDHAAAAAAYDAALALAPSSEWFLKSHAALLRAGRTRDAEARAAQWLKALPQDDAARLYLAGLALDAGRERVAAGHYEEVLKREPDNYVALNNLAGIHGRAGDARALPLAEEAARLRPDDARVADTLGWILVQRGDVARGIRVLERALGLEAPPAVLRYHLAAAYARSGDRERARRMLDALLATGERFEERDAAVALQRSL